MKNKVLYWIAVVAIVAIGCWIVLAPEPDPHLERVQQIESQLADDRNGELSREQRGELFRQMRAEMDHLTDEQKREIWAQMRERSEQNMDRDLEEFFALPEGERVAALDRRIDEMEARRREFAARGANSGGGWSSGRAPGGSAQVNASRAQPSGGGPSRSSSPEARNLRRKERLDESTPEQRAQRAEYFRLLEERRKQRGLPSFGGPRRA